VKGWSRPRESCSAAFLSSPAWKNITMREAILSEHDSTTRSTPRTWVCTGLYLGPESLNTALLVLSVITRTPITPALITTQLARTITCHSPCRIYTHTAHFQSPKLCGTVSTECPEVPLPRILLPIGLLYSCPPQGLHTHIAGIAADTGCLTVHVEFQQSAFNNV
jgi:hypothetical protein